MTDADRQEIIDLWHQGYGARSIAIAVGYSESTVVRFLRGQTHGGVRLMRGKRPAEVLKCVNQYGAKRVRG